MASSFATSLILLQLVLGLLAIGANARPGVQFHPCKTLFISSFTISSVKPRVDIMQNPESYVSDDQNPPRFFSIFREIRDFEPKQPIQFQVLSDIDRRTYYFPHDTVFKFPRSIPLRNHGKPEIRRSEVPFESFGVSSLRDRTRDILSVVVAMLFGIGCGTLTAATMYLAWSLLTNRDDVRESEDYDEDDDVSPKKMGYVMISTDSPYATPAPAPAKEVV